MKLLVTLSLISTALLGLASQDLSAQVGRMNLETHDIVIRKLENAVETLDKKVGQKAPIILRLADLYADRARLKFIAETEKNCNACLGSKKDREAAIKHYLTVIPHIEGDNQAHSLIQTAHLYKILGKTKKALEVYKSVANSKRSYSSLMRGTALGGVGETYFQMAEFKKAKHYLIKALKISETPQPGFLMYRLAWSQLNQGETKTAIKTMISLLSQPKLLELQSAAPGTDRNSFHEDVSRDFATFLAKTSIGQKEINQLMQLSPEPVRNSNLFFLGVETDRLGQKRSSLLVWKNYVSQNKLSTQEELEIQIRVAQLRYDLGHYKTASADFDKAISIWKSKGCRGEDCESLRVRLRNFVTVWNKTIKKTPTLPLLRAYQSYVSLFKDDVEMMFWAGDVARMINRPGDAMELYYQASLVAAELMSHKSTRGKDIAKIFEGALTAQIEMAEATKNSANRKKAYEHYLRLNPKGDIALEVKYQLARLLYDAGDHESAAVAFKKVAYEKDEKQRDIRIKAADLSLDSLVLSKRDETLELWSVEFSKLLPERKNEYLRLQRKASLNLVARALKDPKSSTSDYKEAQNRLKSISLKHSDRDETIAYYKNKMLLGEILKDLDQVDAASKSLLKVNGLSETDEKLALQFQLWVAEMRLEFARAYELSRKVELKSIPKDQKYLKQAIFAELAGKNSEALYREFIKATPSRREANVIRASLIRKDKNMWPGILADLGKLNDTPDILAALGLEAYSKKKSKKSAEKVLKYKAIQKYPEGRALARTIFLEDFAKFEQKIASHDISSRNDKVLQKTLKKRIQLLGEADRWANQAVKSTDWTLQLLTLHRVAIENARLYKTLLKLPVPRGLNHKQRAEYQKMLLAQANPFNEKTQAVSNTISELWSNSRAIDRIKADIKVTDGRVSKIFELELKRIAGIASPSARKNLLSSLDSKNKKPSRAEILKARRQVSKDPFNKNLLEELRSLETQAGGETMVTYLDARLDSLKGVRQ